MWWNLGFPATAFVIFIGLLRPKKRSTEKETQRERLQKAGRFESLRMLRYRSWRNVLRQRQ